MAMNYTRGLVETFTFIILLSTMTCLAPYIFCSFSEIVIRLKHRDRYQTQMIPKIAMLSLPAFLYSAWAITGLGKMTILWGLVLLAGGVPVYAVTKKFEATNRV
jgi:APA family basic amino acid/polyamine antiporter